MDMGNEKRERVLLLLDKRIFPTRHTPLVVTRLELEHTGKSRRSHTTDALVCCSFGWVSESSLVCVGVPEVPPVDCVLPRLPRHNGGGAGGSRGKVFPFCIIA